MKTIVLKSVFVMAFGAMSFTTVHAEPQGTFIYGEDEHTLPAMAASLPANGKRRSQHYHLDLCRMEQKEEEFYRE